MPPRPGPAAAGLDAADRSRGWPPRPTSSCRSARRTPRWRPPGRWPGRAASPGSSWTPTRSPRPPRGRCPVRGRPGPATWTAGSSAPRLTRPRRAQPAVPVRAARDEVRRCSPGRRWTPGSSTAPGAASAVKMAYAAWTKGTAALLLAVRALARAEGVEEALLTEWALSSPAARAHGAASRPQRRRAGAGPARWRRSPPPWPRPAAGGFHQAAAEIFSRSPRPATPVGQEQRATRTCSHRRGVTPVCPPYLRARRDARAGRLIPCGGAPSPRGRLARARVAQPGGLARRSRGQQPARRSAR